MLYTKIVKIGQVVLEKNMLTHDDGWQLIAIGNLSNSGDLKCRFFESFFYLTISKYSLCFVRVNNSWLLSKWAEWKSVEFSATIFFNVAGIFCRRLQLVSKIKAYIVASLAWKKYRYRHILSPATIYALGRQYVQSVPG